MSGIKEAPTMTVKGLDHFNIRAHDLDGMRDFFVDVIGLSEGDRPSFEFPGHWLYGAEGSGAVVHLVGVDREWGYVSGHGDDHRHGTGVVIEMAYPQA